MKIISPCEVKKIVKVPDFVIGFLNNKISENFQYNVHNKKYARIYEEECGFSLHRYVNELREIFNKAGWTFQYIHNDPFDDEEIEEHILIIEK